LGGHSQRGPEAAEKAKKEVSPAVRKRPQAKKDILNHFIYIGRRNLDSAERFLDAVEKAFALLAASPEMGRPWESSSPRLVGVRSWTMPRYKKYRIFYRPIAEGIEVLHVFHASRNFATLLGAEQIDEWEE
jgi:toxin ParE1/3/4